MVGLLGLLGWAACRGLRGVWNVTLGAMLVGIAAAVKINVWRVHLNPAGALIDVDTAVQNALTKTGQKFEHTAGYFFHGAAVIQGWMAREVAGLAMDTLHWAQWLQRVELPKLLHVTTKVLFPWPTIVRFIRHEIATHLPQVGRLAHTITHTEVVHTVTRVFKAAAGAVPFPGWVIHLPRRVGHLERDLPRIRSRLRRLERTAGIAGAVALFVAALSKLGLHWLRCRNVTKVGRAVCATDTNLLTELLGDALVIASIVSVVEFTQGLQAIEDEALGIVHHIVREFPDPALAG